MMQNIRPAAVPLVLSDPYFSVWSFSDFLHGDSTRHWTGERNALVGIIKIDGRTYRFCGKADVQNNRPDREPEAMEQISLSVSALSTEYIFEKSGIELTVTFVSPILPYDLNMVSRPLTYVKYGLRSADKNVHDAKIYTDITGEWCVNENGESVRCGKTNFKNAKSAYMGSTDQKILNSAGDDHRINWGYVHLINPFGDVFCGTLSDRYDYAKNKAFAKKGHYEAHAVSIDQNCPIAACEIDFGKIGGSKKEKYILLAYDDIKSIEYFGEQFCAYWQKDGMTFASMVENAVDEAPDIFEKVKVFENRLYADAVKSGGNKYADIAALAYRQAYAAHKLIADRDGNAVFLSKENYSNGCIGTVDVSYPSIPVFLLYSPELVRGMMRPVLKFAASENWPYDFAPHDVGTYPKANGQVYGKDNGEYLQKYQMPIEECGNMLIMAAAANLADEDFGFMEEHFPIFEKWADYLLEYGYDPENQLCTDDFAGHLAHNCNLSIKAIMGLVSFGIISDFLGNGGKSGKYREKAAEYAAKWKKEAKDGDKYKLAFDQPGTWSLKYNVIWDQIFATGLFGEEVTEAETKWYMQNQNKYGVPLDSRSAYTKTDWLIWSASLCEKLSDFQALVEPVWRFVNETASRVPFSDWYYTDTAKQAGFQNRSVIGGVFMKMLKDSFANFDN
ncbi:MAG: DUF4965 domain-containing protein [Oscillospiraceae bacterium]|nr:DUF4965 domain-containing protein [Oscillospiraceae bacterium]